MIIRIPTKNRKEKKSTVVVKSLLGTFVDAEIVEFTSIIVMYLAKSHKVVFVVVFLRVYYRNIAGLFMENTCFVEVNNNKYVHLCKFL